MALKDDIRLNRDYANIGVEAFVHLMRTFAELIEEPDRVVREHGVTPTQFNVLRILKGSPEGLPQHEIRTRMIERHSDVSRLLDRLVRDGFATRENSEQDARVTLAKITRKGVNLCRKLEKPLNQLHAAQFKKLGKTKSRQLIQLLEELRVHNRED